MILALGALAWTFIWHVPIVVLINDVLAMTGFPSLPQEVLLGIGFLTVLALTFAGLEWLTRRAMSWGGR